MEKHDERAAPVPLDDETAAAATLFDADARGGAVTAPAVPDPASRLAVVREEIAAKRTRSGELWGQIDALTKRRHAVRDAAARTVLDGAGDGVGDAVGVGVSSPLVAVIDDRLESMHAALDLLEAEVEALETAERAAAADAAIAEEAAAVASAGALLDAIHAQVLVAITELPTDSDVSLSLGAAQMARAHREALTDAPLRASPFEDNLPRDAHSARRAATLRLLAYLRAYVDETEVPPVS